MQTGPEESRTYPASKMAKPVNEFTYHYIRAKSCLQRLNIPTVSDTSAVNLLSYKLLNATKSMETELSVYKIKKRSKKGLSSTLMNKNPKSPPSRDH